MANSNQIIVVMKLYHMGTQELPGTTPTPVSAASATSSWQGTYFHHTLPSCCQRETLPLLQALSKSGKGFRQPARLYAILGPQSQLRWDNKTYHHRHRGLQKRNPNSWLLSCVPCHTYGSKMRLALPVLQYGGSSAFRCWLWKKQRP